MSEQRLIDANALLKEIEDWHDSLGGTMNPADWGIQNVLQSVMDYIIEAEDVDAVEEVHGKWESCWEDWRHQLEGNKCSVCGFEYFGNLFKYCPNCGAKMDGGAEG